MSGPRIAIVLGSTRPGRLGDRVCRFVAARAALVPGAAFTVLDLADYPLPFFDETLAPLANPDRVPAPSVHRWLQDVRDADGFYFLTPEYNHTVPAALKNALDFLAREAYGKPAAILSYSSTRHGGTIAGNELRLTLSKVGMLPLPESLPLANADRLLAADGTVTEVSDWADRVAAFVPKALADLVRYAVALKTVRAA
ncbi:NAD(P)H-dependent oxidoreductase [Amycolatopsis minnesotensis]|uniref:NAD(P)H-dependent oxidoreductase n=1 Tax=Amycolatopsis minnesotensis TaxID=337894 RepID=A0ABN2SMX4_9PSEU